MNTYKKRAKFIGVLLSVLLCGILPLTAAACKDDPPPAEYGFV